MEGKFVKWGKVKNSFTGYLEFHFYKLYPHQASTFNVVINSIC